MSISFSNSLQGLHHPGPMGHGTREPGRRGGGCCPGAHAPSQAPSAPGVSGTPRFQTPGVAARRWCSQRRWWATSRALEYREPQGGRLGEARGGDAAGPAGAGPDRLLSGRFSNPRQQPPLRRPRWAPATGGGPCIIGRAACRRVLIGRCASRPRSCARCRLHFVGRGRRRWWVRDGGGQQLVHRCSRALFVACLVSPWKGRGASTPSRSRRRCSLELEVARTSLKLVC
ncbi:proline-rich nuclear receptor coactivator 2 isoform X1 [Manis pentadactyla]|uniref:proline-rich nuclear receptor coactivator 2 isoform X1 n=1 Tax=Manis pentadactyla TaxID=143292 RepID=UPI00255C7640|nr:proline-rich nuclear receptor coactivator 2 isoform X1 [Manis pentadactyla]